MAKWNFTATTNSLIATLDTTGNTVSPREMSYFSPSFSLVNGKIKFYESGRYRETLGFTEVGTIATVAPTNIGDALDKLEALVASFLNGGSVVIADLISSDSSNSIVIGTDGKLYSSGGAAITRVNTYADLPAASTMSGMYFWVSSSTGIHLTGLYYSNGADWESSPAENITVVANYSALPAPNTVTGQFFWVSASQGTSWLPGSVGGTYYNKGIYYSNGVSWEYIDTPYQATQADVITGTDNSKFVTSFTLSGWWTDLKTKAQSISGSWTFTSALFSPTAANGTNNLQVSTTQFVQTAIANVNAANSRVIKAIDPLIVASNNISDNQTYIQNGSYLAATGVYTASTSYISLNKQPITAGKTYTASGFGTLSSTISRIAFYDASNVFISSLAAGVYQTSAPFTFTAPVGSVTFSFTIATGSGIGSSPSTSPYLTTVVINEGSSAIPFEPYQYVYPEKNKVVYVSTTGNDTTGNGTVNFPYATVTKAATELTWKGGDIIMRGGDYANQGNIVTNTKINLKAYPNEKPRIINGIRITSATLEPGYTKVYKADNAVTLPSGTNYIWQHDIADANTVISLAQRNPYEEFLTNRLSSTRIPKAASLADIEASTELKWFNVGTALYFSKVAASDLTINFIVVPQASYQALSLNNVEGITLLYQNWTNIGKMTFKNCSTQFTNIDCFQMGAVADVTFENCIAAGCSNDGFGYALGAKGKEINVWSHDNLDEGSSAHENSTVYREGGFYEFNDSGITDVGTPLTTIKNSVVRYNTTKGVTFTYSSISGVNIGNATLIGVVTDQGISANIAGRVKAYNCTAISGFSNVEVLDDTYAVNTTTVALTKVNLNASYPNVRPNFRVYASGITTGAMIYVKSTEAGGSDVWLSIVATITP